MEFRTSTFSPKIEVKDNTWLVYLLLVIIFFLIYYILVDFGVTGLPVFISALAFFLMAMWFRFHKWFKKEEIPGTLEKEIELNNKHFRIENKIIDYSEISSIQIEIDKYEGQIKADGLAYPDLMKSDGISNRITINTKPGSFCELFRLGNQRHYHDLILTVRELKKNGIDIELNDKS